ncbi:MAG: hypothetical protein HYV60_06675 [Planctomycetia bacterium]|nr:hypothetical protein [Planctomycetia bacterium]
MSQVTIELDVPNNWKKFKLPPALDARLQSLLDKQDRTGRLSRSERQEAKAITELVDMLSLMKLRARKAERRG